MTDIVPHDHEADRLASLLDKFSKTGWLKRRFQLVGTRADDEMNERPKLGGRELAANDRMWVEPGVR